MGKHFGTLEQGDASARDRSKRKRPNDDSTIEIIDLSEDFRSVVPPPRRSRPPPPPPQQPSSPICIISDDDAEVEELSSFEPPPQSLRRGRSGNFNFNNPATATATTTTEEESSRRLAQRLQMEEEMQAARQRRAVAWVDELEREEEEEAEAAAVETLRPLDSSRRKRRRGRTNRTRAANTAPYGPPPPQRGRRPPPPPRTTTNRGNRGRRPVFPLPPPLLPRHLENPFNVPMGDYGDYSGEEDDFDFEDIPGLSRRQNNFTNHNSNINSNGGRGSRPLSSIIQALHQAVSGSRTGSLPPSLLFSDRDFNDEDYEALLALDEGVVNRRGATQAVINQLPVERMARISSSSGDSRGGSTPAVVTDCCICLDKISPGQMVRKLECGHHCFHKTCLDKWLKTKACCPVCQGRI